jgi:hypothetical protein
MPSQPDPVRAALYQRLADDDTLTALLSDPEAIFEEVASSGTTPPYLAFHHHAGTEIWTFKGGRSERALWVVKGICRGLKSDAAEAIDARCTELLHNARLSVEGRTVSVLRESRVSYGESVDGEQWRHRGGIYRIFT